MQPYGMAEFQEPREPAGEDGPGSAKEEFLVALREFRADCGVRSLRALTRVSETLRALYSPPANPQCHLHSLSLSAVSETLSGKRRGMPSFSWVASFVLSCQLYAVNDHPGRRDQGTTILPHWHAIYSAHATATQATATHGTGVEAVSGYRLSPQQQSYLGSHGPHGEVLIGRAQRGHPHARFRVALLLATDESRVAEATGILIETASTGHPLALDLLDVREPAPPGPPGAHLSRRAAGRYAYDLATAAKARGAAGEALVFARAAARGGIPEAALEVAQARLADIDPEAADWLNLLGTQSPAGRHRVDPRPQASP
jgi:hypothetical protein